MASSNCQNCTVQFTSDHIPPTEDRSVHNTLRSYFNSFGNCGKLYINYKNGCGSAVYSNLNEVNKLKVAVQKDNIFRIVFKNSKAVNQMGKLESETCVKKCVDINGQKISLMEDDDSYCYVPVSEAKESGFLVFETAEEARTHVLKELNDFLHVQSAIFFKFKHWSYSSCDFAINVQFKQETSNKQPPVLRTNCNNVDVRNSPENARKINDISPKQALVKKENKGNISSQPRSRTSSLSSPSSNKGLTNRQRMQLITNKSKSTEVTPTKVNFGSPKVEKGSKLPLSRILCLDKMNSGEDGMSLQILSITSKTTFIGFIMSENYLKFDEVLNACAITETAAMPSCGDLVIVKFSDNEISRAYILEIRGNKFKVAAIEYARIAEVEQVFAVPQELLEYAEFACTCEAPPKFVKSLIVESGIDIKKGQRNIIVDLKTKTEIKCNIWTPEPEPEIPTALSAMPPTEKPKVKVEQKIYTTIPTTMVPISEGEKLHLSGFDDVLHLRSKAMHSLITTMNRKLQESNVEKLEKAPIEGQYLLVQFGEKNEWRRCLVKQIEPEGVRVACIDYYNSLEAVNTSRLHNFTPDAIFGPTLLKARLRYFEEKEYSPKVAQFIQECVRKKFDLTFLQGDIIDLKNEESPKNLSEILQDLDTPAYKTLKDLPQVALKINVEITILVLMVDKDRFYFCPTDQASESLIHLDNVLRSMELEDLKEPPVKDQLIVANYEGDWYRGVVKELTANTASLFFIDFGNTDNVDLKKIKQIPEDLTKISAWALEGTLTEGFSGIYETSYTAVAVKKEEELYHVKIIKIQED